MVTVELFAAVLTIFSRSSLQRAPTGLVSGLRSPGAQDLGSLVLTLLAERRESDDSAVRVEHVRDAAVDVLAGEPQFVQPITEWSGVWHAEHVALQSKPLEDPVCRGLAGGSQSRVPDAHLLGELNLPPHAVTISSGGYPL